ncbi:hypothetical protein [Rhodopirellula bahusiensis]|uniref:hypothetical protein n=1 Tax=Rhodopirellula bahusiensis TaxID=2014065 RepID=UPI003266B928
MSTNEPTENLPSDDSRDNPASDCASFDVAIEENESAQHAETSGTWVTRADVAEVVSDAATPIDQRLQEIVSLLSEFEGRLTHRLDEYALTPLASSDASAQPEEPADSVDDAGQSADCCGVSWQPPVPTQDTDEFEQENYDDGKFTEGKYEQGDYCDLVPPEVHRLEEELQAERLRSHELQSQNEALAAQLASTEVTRTVSDTQGCDDSMSWEERKARILEQMENDDFNAESFLESLSQPAQELAAAIDPEWVHNPVAFIDDLVDRLSLAEQTISERNAEIHELQILLQNRADTRNDQVAFGAAAIAGMVDCDELVIEERERLAQLKTEWEDKFRTAEIEASLERAKLSRERQELARRAEELEEQIDQLQREKRDARDYPKAGRRWLAELGLQSEDD